MPTLGDLFDTAEARLEAVASTQLTVSQGQTAALVEDLDDLIGRLREGLQLHRVRESDERIKRRLKAPGDLVLQLDQAQASLQTARELGPDPDRTGLGRNGEGIADATRSVAAARDLIESHRGPDRAPLTPYVHAFSSQSALDYLAGRTARLARHAGQVALRLSQGCDDLGVVEALAEARSCLDRGSALGRLDASAANAALADFPLALPVEPVQASADDPTSLVTQLLGDDCERLSRAAFEALYGTGDHGLSGSDLRQLSRWASMSRLLAGRVVLRLAEQPHLDDDLTDALQASARRLRMSAQAWQQAAAAWHRIVDTADPRDHPKLPPPSYEIVRRGEVVRLPQVVPHPATVIVHASALRVGRLLFGADWRPDGGKPGEPRPADAILGDVGGEGALAAALYRLPATGWQVAAAAPVTIERIQARLVTDSIERRPNELDSRLRFYPVRPRQVEGLVGAYDAVLRAEQSSAVALLRTAQAAGAAVPRATLDTAAHQMIAASQGWASPSSRQDQLASQGPRSEQRSIRPSGAAARTRSTTVPRKSSQERSVALHPGEHPSYVRRSASDSGESRRQAPAR
ncbi:hypothetical protein [Streptomyces sp.]|uniref:hypothetical protein n=1 Tax=Streptomyces sp. TaxID=1931 RepID=UPI002F931038